MPADPSPVEPGRLDPAGYDSHFGGLQHQLRAAGGDAAVQRRVVDELAGWFMLDRRDASPTAALSREDADRFLSWSAALLGAVDGDVIEATAGLTRDVRAVLLALHGPLPVPDLIAVRRVDARQRLAQVRFYRDCDGPAATFRSAGETVQPVFAKRRGVSFFGRVVVVEEIAWLATDGAAYTVEVAGRTVPISLTPRPPARQETPAAAARTTGRGLRPLAGRWLRSARGLLRQLPGALDRPATRWAARGLRGRRYRDAWLLIDRDNEAHDNAEHLYRYLAASRPDINSWFVLDEASPDWPRLAAEGFRLLAHGSREHTMALLSCRHLISSQASGATIRPRNWAALGVAPGWRFHFLQHGIAMSDFSRWLNSRPLELFVCSTPAEYRSVVDDGSHYVFTPREVVLTGLPRHDELLRRRAATTAAQRRYVTVMPTWRRNLVERTAGSAGVWDGEYGRQWRALLSSPLVADAVRAHGLELLFMPHPNLSSGGRPDLGADVTVRTYAETDVQDVLAHTAVLVTDYSSLSFEAALLDIPVLSFQFDREEFFGGGSAMRLSYFDDRLDGFGPVCSDLAEAERALASLVAAGGEPAEPYASRIAATFTLRDGRACERVTRAILDRETPYPGWASA